MKQPRVGRRRKDRKGTRNNGLTAVEFSTMKGKNAYWFYQCICGNIIEAAAYSVERGEYSDCGCGSGKLDRKP